MYQADAKAGLQPTFFLPKVTVYVFPAHYLCDESALEVFETLFLRQAFVLSLKNKTVFCILWTSTLNSVYVIISLCGTSVPDPDP